MVTQKGVLLQQLVTLQQPPKKKYPAKQGRKKTQKQNSTKNPKARHRLETGSNTHSQQLSSKPVGLVHTYSGENAGGLIFVKKGVTPEALQRPP